MGSWKRWAGWLWGAVPSLWVAWLFLQPELKMLGEVWHVARGITAEMFVQAVVVGVSIFVIVHFIDKLWPGADSTIFHALDRCVPHAKRTWPYIARGLAAVGSPIWRLICFFAHWIWRAVTFVGRLIASIFMFIWRMFKRMIPERAKKWSRRQEDIRFVRRVQRGNDRDDDDGERRGRLFANRFMNGSWLLFGLYVSAFLGLNKTMNDPGQPFREQTFKVAALIVFVLLMGQTYRVALIIFMLECYLAWVSATESVQVGTVYMLLFGAAYGLLWLILWRRTEATEEDEDDIDDPRNGKKEG